MLHRGLLQNSILSQELSPDPFLRKHEIRIKIKMSWRGNIIGMFLFVLLGGRLFGEKPPFSLIKPGSETSLIDWSAAIPQFQSLVVHQIDGGRVVDVKPVTFAVSINELRVVETMSCVIEYLQRPEPGKSAPNVRILGFFYRFPYEFNSEWNLCVNDNQRESDDGAGKGWISIDKEKFKIQHFL
jgi:hypothetical protein